MYIGKKMGIQAMWVFARKNLIKTAVLSSAVTCVYQLLHWKFIAIPFLPVATIGTAVAFYIGFKTIRRMTVCGKRVVCGVDLPM